MSYTVYKLTCLITNKVYVGCTKNELTRRVRWSTGHKCYYGRMKEAIEKYGFENFKCEILETNLGEETAFEREKYYIELFDSTNPDKGYNTCKYKSGHSLGNPSRFRGHRHSIESRVKTSNSLKGHEKSDDTKRLMSKNHYLRTPVKCVELNEIFNSLTEAGRVLHVDRHKIKGVLNSNKTLKNFHFVTVERGDENELISTSERSS